MRSAVLLGILVGCGRIGFAPTVGAPADDAATDAMIAPRGHWRSVTVGEANACGITDAGALWCWGDDGSSQLATEPQAYALPPTQVGTASWQAVALGSSASCGIQTDASLWCWGYNSFGELGFGALYGLAKVPTQVDTASWKQIAMGNAFACGLHTDGSLWCWGHNDRGQLGDSSFVDVGRPNLVGNGPYTWVTATEDSACAVDTNGVGGCWGSNDGGPLGDGTGLSHTLPTPIAGTHTWSQLAMSQGHACGLELDGTAWCWGTNYQGQLGDNTTNNTLAPVKVVAPTLVSLDLGDGHSCGVDGAGGAWCWGSTDRGQLGTAVELDQRIAGRIADAVAVSAGGNTTCIIDGSGDLLCTGQNDLGQTGQPYGEGHTIARSDARTDWTTIAAHDDDACGTTGDGHAWCWGVNYNAQIGDGTFRARQAPVDIGTGFKSLAIGATATMAINVGRAFGWGSVQPWSYTVPTDLGVAFPASVVAAGAGHVCSVNGMSLQGRCSGDNQLGQVGAQAFSASATTLLPGTWGYLRASGNSTCGLQLNGSGGLYCWGDNAFGQIGLGAGTAKTATPTVLNFGSPPYADIAIGYAHGCAIANGALWCWGDNTYGQLGDGSLGASPVPEQIGTRTDWTALAAGDLHTCAIAADHTLWCWGHADEGQLVEPLANAHLVPTQLGTDADWAQVAAGRHFTCALKLDGTRWCFGFNGHGNLGDQRAFQTSFLRLP